MASPSPAENAWRQWLVGLLSWAALVGLAVAGRLWQPVVGGEPLWNVTPMAAVALAAGTLFPRVAVAASVPLAALWISNLFSPGYGNLPIATVVFLATAWPVLLGGILRRSAVVQTGFLRTMPRLPMLVGGALASSLVFFLTTNLAHWMFTTDYPHTAAGLAACFTAALPFYRWMPAGDIAWTLAVFVGLTAVARATAPTLTTAKTA
jgi:hypothetical protein